MANIASDNKAMMFIIQPGGFSFDLSSCKDPLSYQDRQSQIELFKSFQDDPEKALFALGFADSSSLLTPSAKYMGSICRHYIYQIAQLPEREFLREKLVPSLSAEEADELIAQAPFMVGSELLNCEWLGLLRKRLQKVYAAEICSFPGSVAEYLAARKSALPAAGRVYFHLVESRQSDYPFAFMATYVSGVEASGKVNHGPLAGALRDYRSDQGKLLNLLSTVYKAAEKSGLIRQFLNSGEIFQAIGLTAGEAYQFLQEIPLYEMSGVICRMPDWWKKRYNSARVRVSLGNNAPAKMGLDNIIDFDASIVLGDLQVSKEELLQLLQEAEGLTLIKGRWVEVDHKRLQAVLQAYEKIQAGIDPGKINIIEAIKMQLWTGQEQEDADLEPVVEIKQGEWLKNLRQHLLTAGDSPQAGTGDNFLARLRPYQEKGLGWLSMMKQLGLGACLADDMGLGKTIQVLALLNGISARRREKNLLVIPASLLGNWRQEIQRFTPNLKTWILHPSEYEPEPDDEATLPEKYDLIITTYGMLKRYEWLNRTNWHTLVLDEAQAIRNPGTRQTRVAKTIKADWRLTLTGTPVENRLTDLWSIFDFLNPGLLGSEKKFISYTKALQEHGRDYAMLRNLLNPFILRRLKTDRSIISDLPDKIEMKTYADLTKKQAVLYSRAVDELKTSIATASGIERKGLVLATILKLKQICNHPDQHLAQQVFQESESGKFIRLREICETIYEKRERVLVFTQFKQMVKPLQSYLESIFEHPGLILHGSTPVSARKKIVDTFQDLPYTPFMILSLKAGGVGLNLTAASHVIHFDRWWNPAVENQATDRAFRIGQSKNVVVHKFITSGTIEEKIDTMLEDKSNLARDIIPDNKETWITELSDKEIIDLFLLTK